MKSIPILFSSLLVLAGCASYPEQVRVADEAALVSFPATMKAGLTQGPARWSGVIAKVQNNSQNTRLEIVYFPSGSHGRPLVEKDTEGRFVAYAKGFLDPLPVLLVLPTAGLGRLLRVRYVRTSAGTVRRNLT